MDEWIDLKTRELQKIEQIRSRLWLGHMAVMVGAGFSRNATRVDETLPMPPDWYGLAVALAQTLYPDRNFDQIVAQKTPLELAEEFVSIRGRDALDTFLRESIDDENLSPGKLFNQFFNLPWTEVLTTNYDTLLEKATENVIRRRFQVVRTADDLIESESPRIVKLHGSIDCKVRHLVFTEEDYRRYEEDEDTAPFVNLVRQTLIEDHLCLIGFSGKDPNFRRWEGWVRDHYKYKEDDPRIFLINANDLSETEIMALASRGICTIDLRQCFPECGTDISLAFTKLFEFLRHNCTNSDWKAGYWNVWDENTPDEKVRLCIENLAREHLSIPNHLALPLRMLGQCVEASNRFSTSSFLRLLTMPSPWDLRGLYELVCRFEHCLSPLFSDKTMLEAYETIMKRYAAVLSGHHFEQDTTWDFGRWYKHLIFAHLRWSRQYCDVDRWNYDIEVYRKILNPQSAADENAYAFERVQQAFALPDVRMLDRVLEEWRSRYKTDEYNVKFAGVLLELGRVDDAVVLLKQTLVNVRKKIPRGRFKGDVACLSIEGAALVSLNMATSKGEAKHDSFERLKQLAEYDCNPWDNLKYYEALLSAPARQYPVVTYDRDLDRDNSSVHQDYLWPKEPLHAFQLIRYFERMGLPFFTPTSTLVADGLRGAVSRIASYSPEWALGLFVRVGRGKGLDYKTFLGFAALQRMSRSTADALIQNYVSQVAYLLDTHLDEVLSTHTNYYQKLAVALQEIISRLAYRAGVVSLELALDLGLKVYTLPARKVCPIYAGMGRYLSRVLGAMTPERVYDRLVDLLAVEIPRDRQSHYDWQNPMRIDWRGFSRTGSPVSKELCEQVDKLLCALDTDDIQYRAEVLRYIHTCVEIGIVSAEQRARLSAVLVKNAECDGFVQNTHLYHVAFKTFFSPELSGDEIDRRLKAYYCEFRFPFFSKKDSEYPLLGWYGDPTPDFSSSILLSSSAWVRVDEYAVELGSDECKTILCNFTDSWRVNKERVLEVVSGRSQQIRNDEHMRMRIQNYDRVLGEVILPRVTECDALMRFIGLLQDDSFEMLFPESAVVVKQLFKNDPGNWWREVKPKLLLSTASQFNQFADAVYCAYCREIKKGNLERLEEIHMAFIGIIANGNCREYESSCRILSKICKDFGLSDETLKVLDAVLLRLLQTMDDGDGGRFEDGERLYAYAKAVVLAARIYCYERVHGGGCSRDGVNAWRNYCESDKAISVYRNDWREICGAVESKDETK